MMNHSIRFATVNTFFPLIIGGVIYIFFRPKTLLMFRITEIFGIDSTVAVNTKAPQSLQLFPEWVVFSLPNALWVYSFSMYFAIIWDGQKCRKCFIWFVYFISLVIEMLQKWNIIPGTFSLTDIILILAACVANQVVITLNKNLSK